MRCVEKRLTRGAIAVVFILGLSGCKVYNASTLKEGNRESSDLFQSDLTARCDANPAACARMGDLLRERQYATSCMALWNDLREPAQEPVIKVYDEFGNVHTPHMPAREGLARVVNANS
jgi:hypothetical protein